MHQPHKTRLLTAALALGAMLLAGCANTLHTQVTNFQAWPQDAAGSSFSIATTTAAESGKWGELERQSYEAQVAQALQAQGLKPVAAGAKARFQATLRLDTKHENRSFSEPVYVPAYAGPYAGPYGGPGAYWGGGVWGDPYFEDGVFARPWLPVYAGERRYNIALDIHLLSVRIVDQQRSKTAGSDAGPVVFEAAAQYAGEPRPMPQLMPYLVRSVFDGFPGQNGQVKQLQFELNKKP